MKSFNTTGPCDPKEHYMLPPEERLVGAILNRYIEKKLYWVLHAPRQTGKTTFLINWMRELNASGKYVASYVSVERCQGIPEIERASPQYVLWFARVRGLKACPNLKLQQLIRPIC
jgi:hypothetical protein